MGEWCRGLHPGQKCPNKTRARGSSLCQECYDTLEPLVEDPSVTLDLPVWQAAEILGLTRRRVGQLLKEGALSSREFTKGNRRRRLVTKESLLSEWSKRERKPLITALESQRIQELFEKLVDRFASDEAKDLAKHINRPVFVGNLVELLYSPGLGSFRRSDVETAFADESFPTAKPPFDQWLERIGQALDRELASEIAAYLGKLTLQDLGSENLRPFLMDYCLLPEDHTGATPLKRLKLTFGPTAWPYIEAFGNRMIEDRAFRACAFQKGWIRKALPPANGEAPSAVVAHVIVTGPDYLLLTQRPDRSRVRYYPNKRSVTLEEMMQGPREVRRRGIRDYEEGDRSLHDCALRALKEELGIHAEDIIDLQLLGVFAEASTVGVVGIFWAKLRIPWRFIEVRVHQAIDPEARAIAWEPLDKASLVQLWFRTRYSPTPDRFIIPPGGFGPGEEGFHPTSRARLLLYLLADRERHRIDEVVGHFNNLLVFKDSR